MSKESLIEKIRQVINAEIARCADDVMGREYKLAVENVWNGIEPILMGDTAIRKDAEQPPAVTTIPHKPETLIQVLEHLEGARNALRGGRKDVAEALNRIGKAKHLLSVSGSEISVIKQAYLALLQLPPDDTFRILNQNIYARLRADVAYDEGRSDEDIQNECEAGIVAWVDTSTSPRNKPCRVCGKMAHEIGEPYCSLGHIRRKRESVVDIEDAVRALWNSYKDNSMGLGNYDDNKKLRPKIFSEALKDSEYLTDARICADAWELKYKDIEDGSANG